MVLLVSGRMFGGGQQVAMDLRRGLAVSGGINPEIWLLGACPAMDGVGDLVIEYDGRYNRPATIASTVRSLWARIRERSPDVIHSHGWDADLIAWLATVRAGVKHVVHLHVLADWLDSGGIQHRTRRQLTRWMIRSATLTLAVSAAVKARWTQALGLSADTVQVVANGIDTVRFAPGERAPVELKQRPLVIGIASRLVDGKGIDIAIDALKLLLDNRHVVALHVAGDGPMRQALVSRAASLGVANHVQWLGIVTEMPAFYRSVDLYLQASLSEGMPLGLLEAMACGCPAVATQVGGTAEVLRHGIEGHLVQPGSAEDLASAISEIIADRESLAAMATAARNRIRTAFDLDQTCASIATLYRQICAGGCVVGGKGVSLW